LKYAVNDRLTGEVDKFPHCVAGTAHIFLFENKYSLKFNGMAFSNDISNHKIFNKMKQTNEKSINQLNNLIEINNDRIQGYEKAAKETKDNDLKSLFTDFALHSSANKSELSVFVLSNGGEPTEATKTTGKIFRAWMDVKAALSGNDRKTILASCITGEDAALETYDEVSKSDAPFSDNIRAVISRQRAGLQKDYDQIKTLRNKVEAEKVLHQ
jgi:uncharacterized protein (TIGR02284 family)